MYCFPSHKLNLLKQMSNTLAAGSCHCRMLRGGGIEKKDEVASRGLEGGGSEI